MVDETRTPARKKKAAKKAAAKKTPVRKRTAESRKGAPVRKKTPVRKKAAAKKELTTEEQFEIEVSKDSAGFPDKDTTTVTATDTADAIQQMDKQNPAGYDEVSIKKKSSGSKEPRTAPVAAEPVKAVSKTTVESKSRKKGKSLTDFGFTEEEAASLEAFNRDPKNIAAFEASKKKKPRRKDGVKVDVNTFELTEGYDSHDFRFPYSIVLPLGYEDFVSVAVGRSDQPIMVVESRGRLKTTLETEAAMDDVVKALVDMVENDIHRDKATMLIKGIMGSFRRR